MEFQNFFRENYLVVKNDKRAKILISNDIKILAVFFKHKS